MNDLELRPSDLPDPALLAKQVREVVAEQPNAVADCYYVRRGLWPECAVGVALVALGVHPAWLATRNGAGIAVLYGYGEDDELEGPLRWLAVFQDHQDGRFSWQCALDEADGDPLP